MLRAIAERYCLAVGKGELVGCFLEFWLINVGEGELQIETGLYDGMLTVEGGKTDEDKWSVSDMLRRVRAGVCKEPLET